MKKLILLFFVFCLVSNCSIEKRRYRSGYSIEWNSAKSIKEKSELINIEDIEDSLNKTDQIHLIASIDNRIYISYNNQNKTAFPDTIKRKKKKKNIEEPYQPRKNNLKGKELTEKKLKENQVLPKTHPLAIASLIVGILGLLSVYGLAIGISGLVSVFGWFLGGLLSLIFGIIALKHIREQSEKYKGKGLARTGLILGMIALTLFLIVLVLVIIILNSGLGI